MNFYTVKLESFHIDNTRSRHNDTDTVTFGVQVGMAALPILTFNAGDVNNGDHGVGLHVSSILISDADRPLALSYSIYNGSPNEASTNLNQLATSLLTKGVQFTTNGPSLSFANLSGGRSAVSVPTTIGLAGLLANTSAWYAAVAKVMAEAAINFLFPNCDGFVAGDVVGMTHQQWDQVIDSQGNNLFRSTMSYPGTNSQSGCGSNSIYSVTWSVTREAVRGSFRQFLKSRGRSAAEGVRMLSTTGLTV
jgi:hypothetical protein